MIDEFNHFPGPNPNTAVSMEGAHQSNAAVSDPDVATAACFVLILVGGIVWAWAI